MLDYHKNAGQNLDVSDQEGHDNVDLDEDDDNDMNADDTSCQAGQMHETTIKTKLGVFLILMIASSTARMILLETECGMLFR